jgi:hypothetical protein
VTGVEKVSALAGKTSCPRCNAIADVMMVQRDNSDVVVISSRCPKCKKSCALGFTSKEGMRISKRIAELKEARRSMNASEGKDIDDEIESLEAEERIRELGL